MLRHPSERGVCLLAWARTPDRPACRPEAALDTNDHGLRSEVFPQKAQAMGSHRAFVFGP